MSQQPQQWSSTQLDSSLTSIYNRRPTFDNGTKNPEGI
jgi:hypothetical protein